MLSWTTAEGSRGVAQKDGKKALWRYTMEVRRVGTVEGLFTATDEEIQQALGREVDFGEVLGKHSNIRGVLEEKEFKRLTDDPAFIEKFDRFKCASGHNPLKYLAE